MHHIQHRTLSISVCQSLARVTRAIRYALRIAGRGSAVHAWTDNPEAPVLEVRDAAGWPVCIELDADDYVGLRLYFRQWED